MNPFFMALLSICISVAAQFCLKAGMSTVAVKSALTQPFAWPAAWVLFTQPFVVAGFVLYGLGAVVWLSVLSRWEVSKAYPMVGFGFALTMAVGAIAGEEITVVRVFGVALICIGVWVISQS
ncbi:hypothetical protein WG899_20580 [Paucibacter sp. AS339]|uniref:hypothetical protein n=1 Tax=Paucibacter hankyongi TaxID=3133434 RepID=UPI0030B4CC97